MIRKKMGVKFFYYGLIGGLVIIANAFAATSLTQTNLSSPGNCPTLKCVRHHIDVIDDRIVKLLALRLAYVKRAGELKQGKVPLHDQRREKQVLWHVAHAATQSGFPATIALAVFKTIIKQSIAYERQFYSTVSQ